MSESDDIVSSSNIAVPLTPVLSTGEVNVLLVIVCVPESEYDFVTTSPGLLGAVVESPTMVLSVADMITSPTCKPFLTTRLRFVIIYMGIKKRPNSSIYR